MSAVTEAGLAYASALAAMHASAFPHEPWNEAAFNSLLCQPGVLALVHEAGGFALLRIVLDEAEILSIGVMKKRRGIGDALLSASLIHAQQAGVQTMFLEVATSNAAARQLYAKHGFVSAGLRKGYYEDGDDALTMRLDLDQSETPAS